MAARKLQDNKHNRQTDKKSKMAAFRALTFAAAFFLEFRSTINTAYSHFNTNAFGLADTCMYKSLYSLQTNVTLYFFLFQAIR